MEGKTFEYCPFATVSHAKSVRHLRQCKGVVVVATDTNFGNKYVGDVFRKYLRAGGPFKFALREFVCY